jgi:hypothetical protein
VRPEKQGTDILLRPQTERRPWRLKGRGYDAARLKLRAPSEIVTIARMASSATPETIFGSP